MDGKTAYSEGIFMGYRWFDQQQLTPLFAFGHGLSYSRFVYSEPSSHRTTDGGVDVMFTVRNAGKLAGDEVPQIYVGPPVNPPEGVQFAVKSLVAFDRIRIGAGGNRSA